MKIYDGDNADSLILYELSSTHFNTVFNETITSTDSTVFIKLTAGSRQVGGIYFLLSWTTVDVPFYKKQYITMLDVKCKYLYYNFYSTIILY
jgi:hypothetical protein